jgi:hypothetical protein
MLPGGKYRFFLTDLPEAPPAPLAPRPRPSAAKKLLNQVRAKAAGAPDSAGFVYFVRLGDGGPIKIGFAIDPPRRIRALQIANHRRLVLIGVMAANPRVERAIHQAFQTTGISGEWFRPSQRLLAFIAEAIADG